MICISQAVFCIGKYQVSGAQRIVLLFSLKVRIRQTRKPHYSSCGRDQLAAWSDSTSQNFLRFKPLQGPSWAATRKQLSNNATSNCACYFQLPANIAGYMPHARLTPRFALLPSKSLDNSGMREKDVGLHSCNLRHKASIEVGLNSMFNLQKNKTQDLRTRKFLFCGETGYAPRVMSSMWRSHTEFLPWDKFTGLPEVSFVSIDIHHWFCMYLHCLDVFFHLFSNMSSSIHNFGMFNLNQLNMFVLQISSSRNAVLVCWEALLSSFLCDDLPFQYWLPDVLKGRCGLHIEFDCECWRCTAHT